MLFPAGLGGWRRVVGMSKRLLWAQFGSWCASSLQLDVLPAFVAGVCGDRFVLRLSDEGRMMSRAEGFKRLIASCQRPRRCFGFYRRLSSDEQRLAMVRFMTGKMVHLLATTTATIPTRQSPSTYLFASIHHLIISLFSYRFIVSSDRLPWGRTGRALLIYTCAWYSVFCAHTHATILRTAIRTEDERTRE